MLPDRDLAASGALVSSGWVNPSLTYMALTARAAAHAVELLNRREL